MTKEFIYLVQGKAALVKDFKYLSESDSSDALLLTYDREIEDCIYLPDSTWGEGRNRLLEEALKQDNYSYYIFLDDDLRFVQGGFRQFENMLRKYRPAVAYPVFIPNSHHTIFGIGISPGSRWFYPFFRSQICRFGDAQLMAFHRDVIKDRLLFPMQTMFDSISWWGTSSTQQLLVFNLYEKFAVQFNGIRVVNEGHGEYINNAYKEIQSDWLASQFKKPIKDPRQNILNLLSVSGLVKLFRRAIRNPRYGIQTVKETIATFGKSILYRPNRKYSFSEDEISTILKEDSVLYRQYMEARGKYRKSA